MAELCQTTPQNITLHLKNTYQEREVVENAWPITASVKYWQDFITDPAFDFAEPPLEIIGKAGQ